jgi:Flp pilus assembly protein TadG
MPPIARRLVQRTSASSSPRGQSIAEFALIFPLLFLLLAGIIQFGLVFWAQNTLTQVARDTGRWAATQVNCTPGNGPGNGTAPIVATANSIAAQSSLLGYTTGAWTSPTNVVVNWTTVSGTCPPVDNQEVSFITISLTHRVPVFFPLIPFDGTLRTTTQFRMEPTP